MLSRAIVLVTVVASAVAATVELHPLSDAFIDLINSKQSSWKAGKNFPLNTPLRKLVGAHPKSSNIKLRAVEHDPDLIANLPENFDPRDKWPNCPSLNEIRDQASCGSCWAFGAVEAMTDRYCIHSDGKEQFHFSAEDLISCCGFCGDCQGGVIEYAWAYWETGLVSGGNYGSSQGCKPYPFHPCKTIPFPSNDSVSFVTDQDVSEDLKPCISHLVTPTPECTDVCFDKKLAYDEDKRRGEDIYVVQGEENIKAELFKNGPVEGSFSVFSDFFNYKSGVYKYTAGDFIYGHAIKIIGYGVENGEKYWLISNSWNEGWGDKGFFKILRGENHLGIEDRVVTGIPSYKY